MAPVALARTDFPGTGWVVNPAATVRLDRPEGFGKSPAPSPVGAGGLDPLMRASLGWGRTAVVSYPWGWGRTAAVSLSPAGLPWGAGHSRLTVRNGTVVWLRDSVPVQNRSQWGGLDLPPSMGGARGPGEPRALSKS